MTASRWECHSKMDTWGESKALEEPSLLTPGGPQPLLWRNQEGDKAGGDAGEL